MRTWYSAAAADGIAELAIYDEIGIWGVTAADFRDSLAGLGKVDRINLRLNSPGGDVFAGLAIHNMLARHPAFLTVTVDGIAASISSVIAMAGDEIIMPENAMMMIHNPFGVVVGTADDMRDMAEALDKIRGGIVSTYARRSGQNAEAIIALMDAETWLTAKEAKASGFADKVSDPAKIAAKYSLSRFANPPAAALALIEPEAEPVQEPEAAPEPQADPGEAPPEVTEPDPEAMQAAIRAATRAEISQIVAACQIARRPEMALAFVQSGKPLAEVRKELQTLERAPVIENEINPHATIEDLPISWSKQINRFNSKFDAQ
jgi:ATP-dependent Clp protease protease subunit